MKTIFILIPWFQPAYKGGGPIQSVANLTNQFTGQLLFKVFTSNLDLDKTVLDVKTDSWIRHDKSTEVWYSSKKQGTFNIIRREIKRTNARDLFIIGIYSWKYNILPLLFCRNCRKIISVSGMLHPGALSQKRFKKKIYLGIWKLLGIQYQCEFHASNEEEKLYIQRIFGKKVNIYIAPNFPRQIKQLSIPEKKAGHLQLISIALISPMKNHFLILEALSKCISNIEYNIYGPVKHSTYWNMCVELIKKLPKNILVNYHGDIPPFEVETALSKNQVFILPSKSENFGHAFYEALSAGKPLITSHNTPWNNLKEYMAGINVAIDKPQELIDAIEFFASMDVKEFEKWVSGAKDYCKKSISIEDIRQQHKEMFII